MAYYRSLSCGILTLVFLVLGEFGLNSLRAVLKGESLWGDDSPVVAKANAGVAPEQDPFVFNSRPISKNEYSQKQLRLWVSSASHAADHHGIDKQFANLLCNALSHDSCYVLNASRPGLLLKDNLEFLHQNLEAWKPDYVLLYQAYLDIHHSAHEVPTETEKADSVVPNEPRVAEQIKQRFRVEEFLRSTILRNYSRNYLGSSFLLATPLLSELPESEKDLFEQRLVRFIEETTSAGSIPILTTFVSVHGSSKSEIDWQYQTWLMRYFEDISPETVNDLILEYNDLIREVAQRFGVATIDLDQLWSGEERKNQFDDFVHFSASGHRKVAQLISNELMGIVR